MAQCTAKSKRTGLQCGQPAMVGKTKCRLHGGKSTGAKTPEGLKKVRENTLVHGQRSRFYKDVLLTNEQEIYDNAEVGTLDEEIRFAKTKLIRLETMLRDNKDIIGRDLLPDHVRHVQEQAGLQMAEIRKLEQARAQIIAMLNKGDNDDDDGVEIVTTEEPAADETPAAE